LRVPVPEEHRHEAERVAALLTVWIASASERFISSRPSA
jgi:hypothetical protein